MKVKKCAFTGHRPQSLPFGFNETDERCIALKQMLRAEIIRLIEQEGVTQFHQWHGNRCRYVCCGDCAWLEINL